MNSKLKVQLFKFLALQIAAFLIAIANPILSQPNLPLDPEVKTDSFPVTLDDRTLFSIKTGIQVGENLYTPTESAKIISYSIEEVANGTSIPFDAIRIDDKPVNVKLEANK